MDVERHYIGKFPFARANFVIGEPPSDPLRDLYAAVGGYLHLSQRLWCGKDGRNSRSRF